MQNDGGSTSPASLLLPSLLASACHEAGEPPPGGVRQPRGQCHKMRILDAHTHTCARTYARTYVRTYVHTFVQSNLDFLGGAWSTICSKIHSMYLWATACEPHCHRRTTILRVTTAADTVDLSAGCAPHWPRPALLPENVLHQGDRAGHDLHLAHQQF